MDNAHDAVSSGVPPTGLIAAVPPLTVDHGEGSEADLPHLAGDDTSESNVHGHLAGLFGRDTIYLLLWALQLGLAAIVTPVATRLLGSDAFGGVIAANAVMQILFIIVCLGLSTGIEKRIFEENGLDKARRLMTLSIMLAVSLTTIAYATGPLWAKSLGFTGFTRALQYAVLWAGISGVTACGLSMLRAQDRLLPFGIASLLQSVIAEVASLLIVIWWAPTADHFLLGQLGAQVVATIWVLGSVKPAVPGRADVELAKTTLVYTIPLVPAMLSGFALASADRLIVQKQLGEIDVARYQIAYNIGSIPILLLSLINGAWMPRFFSLENMRDRSALVAAARDGLFRLLIPVIVGLSFGAPLVLRVWAPNSYQPDRLLIVLFLTVVSAVPFAASLSANRALLITGHTSILAGVSIVAAAANIGLNIVMVKAYGLAGAAGATFLSYALLHFLQALKARKELPTPPVNRVIVVGLLVAVGASWGLALVPASDIFVVIRALGAAVCVAWFVVISKNLSRGKGIHEEQVGIRA